MKIIIISIFVMVNLNGLSAESSIQDTITFENYDDNKLCLKCHGGGFYYYENTWIEKIVKERMNPYYVIDSSEFYMSNHKTFYCIDCHTTDYEEFPHSGEARMEEIPTCIDCHGGDKHYLQYHFDEIESEFQKSVHSSRHDETFTCWMCHNPHSYKINARTNDILKETISYDNEICLSCHADIGKYQLLTSKENPNVITSHEWLPNQVSHFKHVRCIECHAELNDSVMIAHNVLPKEFAVKKCVECHTKDSRLISSLYKFQISGFRDSRGYYNPIMLEEGYVIGANRNLILNISSLIIFGLCIGFIGLHAVLRLIFRK